MQARERVEQSRFTVFFQSFVAPEGRKVGSPKRRVRSHLARWEMKSCTPLWHEAHLQVKKLKAPHVRSTFGSWEVEMWKKCAPLWRQAHFEVKMYKAHRGQNTFRSWDVEKVYAVVARSTFRSQKCKELMGSEYFWKLTCRKYACHCGAKHISKSECTKHFSLGTLLEAQMSTKCTPLWREALLEVEMLKKCTPLWREAHFQVRLLKAPHVRTTFEGSDVVLCGRRKGFRTWATTHYRKNSFATFYLFARLHLLSSHSFSSSFCWLFLFSDAARPVHRIGSLASKSPSVLYNVNPGLINL